MCDTFVALILLILGHSKKEIAMRNELLKGLTKDQIERVRACSDAKQLLALARREGIELTSEQLEAIYGGACTSVKFKCPVCDSDNVKKILCPDASYDKYICQACGHEFER